MRLVRQNKTGRGGEAAECQGLIDKVQVDWLRTDL